MTLHRAELDQLLAYPVERQPCLLRFALNGDEPARLLNGAPDCPCLCPSTLVSVYECFHRFT